MRTHNLRVKNWVMPVIKSGNKKIEVRLYTGRIPLIKKGDLIIFNESCFCTAGEIRLYSSLEALVDTEGASAIYPGSNRDSVLQGLQYLYRFSDHEFGFVAIEVALRLT